ncbi:metalloregulator ArsR/SmtB family transcription factor [Saccharibacillus sp. CPCC 101409]|uniref:ArsR/SmtB family transcription factor n=1 Tax=Saccharibacillus sp. CPCC 101409 TaxID=3058041 RepID=UPI002670FD1E|nr:metalloregulator ArsR/SmtB family transcription factor [Saccharibacillus sp. CPCC 101409]MDO3409903.1 metalloregulator ArsR/SmtB family transcription factor [Saccharibacillus sp. CPCC 101409]
MTAEPIEVFGALAEPSRMRIVTLLRRGPLNVGEIAGALELRQPQASKHLKILQEAGLVEAEAEANRRHYRLKPESFRALDAWLDDYRQLWSGRFDRLDEYLPQMQTKIQPKSEEE